MLDNECIQILSSFIDYELQDQDDKNFLKQTFSSIEISSQSLSENMKVSQNNHRLILQRNKVKNDNLVSWHGGHPEQMYSYLDQLNIGVYTLEDPFEKFLESTKEIKYFLILSFVDKFLIGCRITVLTNNKHMQQKLSKYIMLEWLHWLFHFT